MDSVRIAVRMRVSAHTLPTLARMSARLVLLAAALFVAAGYLAQIDVWAAWLFVAGGIVSLVFAAVDGVRSVKRRRLARA